MLSCSVRVHGSPQVTLKYPSPGPYREPDAELLSQSPWERGTTGGGHGVSGRGERDHVVRGTTGGGMVSVAGERGTTW